MLRMRWRLSSILRGLLTFCGFLVLGMWFRSFEVEDRYLARRGQDEWGLRSRWGLIFIELPAVPISTLAQAPFRHESVSVWRSYSPLIAQEREWDALVLACYRTLPARSL